MFGGCSVHEVQSVLEGNRVITGLIRAPPVPQP